MRNVAVSFAVVALLMLGYGLLGGLTRPHGPPFPDVPDDHWAYDAVEALATSSSGPSDAPAMRIDSSEPFPPKPGETGKVKLPGGLSYTIVRQGNGEPVKKGATLSTHWTGWLRDGKRLAGTNPEPLDFQIGLGRVIAGWDQGILGMKTGEVRRLYIPSKWGYGGEGVQDAIPPNADLVFEVVLLSQHDSPR